MNLGCYVAGVNENAVAGEVIRRLSYNGIGHPRTVFSFGQRPERGPFQASEDMFRVEIRITRADVPSTNSYTMNAEGRLMRNPLTSPLPGVTPPEALVAPIAAEISARADQLIKDQERAFWERAYAARLMVQSLPDARAAARDALEEWRNRWSKTVTEGALREATWELTGPESAEV